MALNPRGKVPALRDGDFVLYESLAIMQYLECKYPANPLFGRTPRETGAIWRVISEFGAYPHMPLSRISGPFLFDKSEEKASDIRAALPEVHGELEKLEAAATNSAWLGGKAVTAADVAIYPVLMLLLRASARKEAEPFKLRLLPFEDRYPRLGAWMERIEDLPRYDNTYPPHWRQQNDGGAHFFLAT